MTEIIAYALVWFSTVGILAAVLGLPPDYTKARRFRVVRPFRLSDPMALTALVLLAAGAAWTILLQ